MEIAGRGMRFRKKSTFRKSILIWWKGRRLDGGGNVQASALHANPCGAK